MLVSCVQVLIEFRMVDHKTSNDFRTVLLRLVVNDLSAERDPSWMRCHIPSFTGTLLSSGC